MLKIVALGGLGEIGLNMMVFEYGNTMFVVDAGLMFPEDYMLGIDYVIPDMTFLRQNAEKVAGVVLTHAHEDHIGALSYLLRFINCPVFGTPFTLGMVRHRLEEQDLLSQTRLYEIHPGEHLRLGPFEMEFVRVGHSVVEGIGLAVDTPEGRIIHTGDFKISHPRMSGMGTDIDAFARCGRQGILALLSDSTNVEKEGFTISDREIGDRLAKIVDDSGGRVIVALFASNILRIQQIVDAALACGRRLCINGKSIEVSVGLARELGHIRIPAGVEVDIEEVRNFPDEEMVIVTTGSQGEPMSALARMAVGAHKQIKIRRGDTVVLSSKFIPGNEKAIAGIINHLYRRGADVIYEKISEIHVSGHAFKEELRSMIRLTRPRYFIPIHGEYRHLVLHGRLAKEAGIAAERVLIAENGQTIVFEAGLGRVEEKVRTGRILIDGKGIGDVGRSVLKERRLLSEDGLVVVTMAFDEETGIVVYGPEIVSRGFVFEQDRGHLLQDAQCVVLEIVEEVDPGTPDRVKEIRSRLQTALRQYFFFAIGRRPVILPFLLEV